MKKLTYIKLKTEQNGTLKFFLKSLKNAKSDQICDMVIT